MRVPTSWIVRETLARRWLAARELTMLSRRAVEKRRNEFVAGRLAAKTAAARLRGMPITRDVVHTLVADGENAGQPIAVEASGARMQDVYLSITHSNSVAIAAAATKPIGIDLAPVEPRARSFDEDAFLDGELDGWHQLLGASTAERVRAVAFAAKEAALKWLGVGLRVGLHDIRVSPTALTSSSPSADLGLSTTELTVRMQMRCPDSPAGSLAWRNDELHGLMIDVGQQVLVTLAGDRAF
jgi:4'-phosphopantetheinyl transferase EntD